ELQTVVVGFAVDLGMTDRHAELQTVTGEPVELEGVGDRQVNAGDVVAGHGLRAVTNPQIPLVVDVVPVGAGDRRVGQTMNAADHGRHETVGVARNRVEAGFGHGQLVDISQEVATIATDLYQLVFKI